MKQLDKNRFVFILSVYGTHAKVILEYAQGKEGLIIVQNIPRKYLSYLDIHLVSLLSEWDHICVPSKAVSAICSGSTVLFCGNEQADNWLSIHEAAWRVNDDKEISENIKAFYSTISLAEIQDKKKNAQNIMKRMLGEKQKGFHDVLKMIS